METLPLGETWGIIEQGEEDKLHKYRLLNVEEKPFKRITKRLLGPNSIITAPLQLPPTPPPDSSAIDEEAAANEAKKQKQLDDYRQFREDVILDFAAFDSSIVRIQFLLNSNANECELYAQKKLTIQDEAQGVRENTTALRRQLEEAQRTLVLRKTYDELAEKITNNRLLRPREDQHANLEKLETEIAELEKQSKDYAQTWAERRQQFGRIIEEGQQMRRLIRDEKEEVERREGMEEREDGEEGDTASQRGRISTAGTPRPEAGGATPAHPGLEGELGSSTVNGLLMPRGRSQVRSPGALRAETPVEEDIDMAEDGEVSVEEASDTLADKESPSRKDETCGTTAEDHMDTS